MQEKVLYIKNMVCPRCIRVVREDLTAAGLEVLDVRMGQSTIKYDAVQMNDSQINEVLKKSGFALLVDEEKQLVEKVKAAIIKMLNSPTQEVKNSHYIELESGIPYARLSKVFSASEGITIEQYLIGKRIEKVKELIKYDQLPIKEIAYVMGYSSVAYLSNQFKQITGQKLSEFRKELFS